jgi:transcriptional regulator with XRE-family HTH domain
MDIVEGKIKRRGGKQMPKDKRFGKKWRMRDRYFGRYHEHPGVLVPGIKACRWAAALSERDLAELVGTSQTRINNFTKIRLNWLDEPQGFKADDLMLERLCQALKVWPEDLTTADVVEGATSQDGAEQRSVSVSDEERAERRREVNRIKGDFAIRYTSSAIKLGGLKARRLEAGLSQEELARMIGTNLTTIRQLEKRRGGRSAYAKTVQKLCQVLGVRPADLICWDPVK